MLIFWMKRENRPGNLSNNPDRKNHKKPIVNKDIIEG